MEVPRQITEDEELNQTTLMEVATLKAGDSFGELALITNATRAASIKTKTSCHFATLDKASYNNFLGLTDEIKLEKTVHLLSE